MALSRNRSETKRKQQTSRIRAISASIACALVSGGLNSEGVLRQKAVQRVGGFPAVFELSSLDGSNGFVIDGSGLSVTTGRSVSSAGDVNGDGIDDVIIGVYVPISTLETGKSYVVFGGNAADQVDLANLNGNNGFVLNGIDPYDDAGRSVSGAGDVNGDGIDDVIVGAPRADPGGVYQSGESYVVFGKRGGFDAILNLAMLDGSNGFVLNGIGLEDRSGSSVSAAGDVNSDGVGDVIIGADRVVFNGGEATGAAYVVFGSTSGFSESMNLSSLDGSNGFVIYGATSFDHAGHSVSAAGDINGDGIDDVVVGAYGAINSGVGRVGASYVIFGSSGGFGPSIELASLNPSDGFPIFGILFGDGAGRSVSAAGDMNGDNIDDLIIGAKLADPGGNNFAGQSYAVFGTGNGSPDSFNLSNLNGSNGFVFNGAGASDQSGISVSGVGDINKDGFDDVVIGARFAGPGGVSPLGQAYVVFGSNSAYPFPLDPTLLDGRTGFVINGSDRNSSVGDSVSDAGDFNNDGVDDLLVGAPGVRKSFIVFGIEKPIFENGFEGATPPG